MKRAMWIIATLVVLSACALLMSGCQVNPQEDGVPAGVTVTIPEGL